ncbi:unnamed protein product [marine sediment metagenome]|uniref:Uncharacterized protein n=1 Tax=marine sediment metagenome TaxID=412755 RepID=X0X6E6_9ZZZZ
MTSHWNEQTIKTSLFKMAIGSKDICQIHIIHNYKANAVYQSPEFV